MLSLSELKQLGQEHAPVVIFCLLVGAVGGWAYGNADVGLVIRQRDIFKIEAEHANQRLSQSVAEIATLKAKITDFESVEKRLREELVQAKQERLTQRPLAEAPARVDDIREQLRPDKFKLIVNELAVAASPLAGGAVSMNPDDYAKATFTIENNAGMDVGIALQQDGYTFGPCTPGPNPGIRFQGMPSAGVFGPPTVDPVQIDRLRKESNPLEKVRWFPAGTKLPGTVVFWPNDCRSPMFGDARTIPASVTVVVATKKDVLVLSLAADGVPIRLTGK